MNTAKLSKSRINKIRILRGNGFSFRETAKEVKVAFGSSYKYGKNVKISERGKKRLLKREKEKHRIFAERSTKRVKMLKIHPRLGRVIGHCLFDGSVFSSANNTHCISYTNSSKKLVDQFIDDIWVLFRQKPNINELKRKHVISYQVKYCSKEMQKFLHLFVSDYSTSKSNCRIKDIVFKQNRMFIKNFLRAFWEDEGCITLSGRIVGSSKSKKIINQLKTLHNKIGIITRTWHDKNKDFCYIFINKDRENLINFYKNISPLYSITKSKYDRGNLKRNRLKNLLLKNNIKPL